jgi:hypothetical protein
MSLRLKVYLAGATGLKKMDIIGSSDPYVKLRVGSGKEQKTKVRKRSLNPKWGDVFYFDLEGVHGSLDPLRLNVFDWDRFKSDDPLGDCEVDLNKVPLNTDHPMVVPLSLQGELRMELHIEDRAATGLGAAGGSAAAAAAAGGAPAVELAPAPTAIPPAGQQPIVTQDPFGVVYFGQPVVPTVAYEGQAMPPAYLFTPPPAYYAPPAPMMDQYAQYNFAPPAAAPPPPPFYYGAPVAYEAPPYSPIPPQGWAPIAPPDAYASLAADTGAAAVPASMEAAAAKAEDDIGAAAVPEAMEAAAAKAEEADDGADPLPPHMAYAPNTEYKPIDETCADFSDDDHKSTNQPYSGDYWKVSHLNYFSNYLETIQGLSAYPNLMRLTLRENNLKSLAGISESPYLRWIDVSNNYLEDFRGMGTMMNLEWLDAHNNNIDNLGGLDWAPNLTYINLHANHMTTLQGAEKFQALRWFDLSESDIKSARGLESCMGLQEINLAANYLQDVDSILALANLPHLFRVNIYYNDFKKKDFTKIVNHFFTHKPQCEVITTKKDAARVGHNVKWIEK